MKSPLLRALFGLILGLALIAVAWQIVHRPSALPSVPPPPSAPSLPPKVTREQVERFYNEKVSPLIATAEKRDREAVKRAMQQIHGSFEGFRAGIPGFAEDVTSWGTRGGVIQRMAQDQWKKWWGDTANAHQVSDYVGDKFKGHVLSEQKLQNALEQTLDQLRSDLSANHNQLAAEIKAAVTSPQCPVQLAVGDWSPWFAEIERSALKLSRGQATDSVAQAALALVGSGIATMAGEQIAANVIIPTVVEPLVQGILVRLAASGVVTAVAGGGTAGSFGVGGGAAGSLGGPAGTVIAAGIGLAVGCVVDWWLTDSFKAKLRADCTTFLNDVERQMVVGEASKPGLNQQLLDAVAQQDAVLATKLLDELRAKVP